MNTVYLKKLIHQETLNVKVQLVKEHIEIAKLELAQINENVQDLKSMSLIVEQGSTTSTTTTGPTPVATTTEDDGSWKEPDDVAAKFIENFPDSVPVNRRDQGSNPDSYEVTVQITPAEGSGKKAPYKNLFRFYEDGSVYDFNLMTRLGWEYQNNQLHILAKNPGAIISTAGDTELATIDSNGVFRNSGYTEHEASVFDKPEKNTFLDTFQTILDWAGFIPVIGDAIDVINAIIYFVRGKMVEGFLSLIAIIPIVGSALKMGIKGAFKAATMGIAKGFKAVKLSKVSNLLMIWWAKKQPGAMGDVLEQIYKAGKATGKKQGEIYLELKDMITIGNWLGTAGGFLKRSIAGIKKIPLLGDSKIFDRMEGWSKLLVSSKKSVVDKAAKIAKQEKLTKIGKEGFKIWKVPGKAFKYLTFGLLPKLKKMPWYPAKQLEKMAQVTQKRFIEKVAKQPRELAALATYMSPRGLKSMSDSLSDISKQADNLKYLESSIPNPKYLTALEGGSKQIQFKALVENPGDLRKFLGNLSKKTDETSRLLYREITQDITKKAVENDNPLWHVFKDSDLQKIISSQFAVGLKTQFAKNVDWFWNELQMAGETLGFESSEHLGQVGIVPLTKWAVAEMSPGGYKKAQEAIEGVREMLEAGQKGANVVFGPNIQLQDLDEYPPLGAEQYTYGQEE